MAATDYIIFGAVLGVFFLLVLCVLSVVFWQDKGQAGENQIHQSLNRLEGQSAILQNCYLPLKNSGTTEVDLILIHESGIYVIESKNYSGWIFGSESQRYWTQSLPGHNGTAEKHRFYNPIWQTSVYKGYKQDKIEMRGDRAEMSDFPLYLNTVAGGLDRRDQTIGGFSFVVKIYAVPVIEIIG